MKGLEMFQPFVKEAHQRNQHLARIIEQARMDKMKSEAEEQNARRERQKKVIVEFKVLIIIGLRCIWRVKTITSRSSK